MSKENPPAKGVRSQQTGQKDSPVDLEASLDEALEETFPASDPIAVDGPTKPKEKTR